MGGLSEDQDVRLARKSAGIQTSGSTKIIEVNLSAFICRLFHEDFSSIVGINPVALQGPEFVHYPAKTGLTSFQLNQRSWT